MLRVDYIINKMIEDLCLASIQLEETNLEKEGDLLDS